jgi:hypothetical protein
VERFLRFLAGAAIAIVYWIVASGAVIALSSAFPDWWLLFAVVALAGWIAICVVPFRKEQPWIGYGAIAGPFIALLVVTISCFALVNVNGFAAAAA